MRSVQKRESERQTKEEKTWRKARVLAEIGGRREIG